MKTILFLLVVAFIGYSVISDPKVSEQIQIHLAAVQRHALEIAKEKASQAIAEHGDEIVSVLTSQLQAGGQTSPSQPGLTKIYTSRQITSTTTAGVRSIPAGTEVQIVRMSGDQVSVTDGKVVVTTTPDSLTDVAPAHNGEQSPGNQAAGPPSNVMTPQAAVQQFLDAQFRNAGMQPAEPGSQPLTNTDSYGQTRPPAYNPTPAPAKPAQPLTANEIYNEKIRSQIKGIDEQIDYLQQEIKAARYRDNMARAYGNSSSHRVTISRHNLEVERLQNRKHNLISQLR